MRSGRKKNGESVNSQNVNTRRGKEGMRMTRTFKNSYTKKEMCYPAPPDVYVCQLMLGQEPLLVDVHD